MPKFKPVLVVPGDSFKLSDDQTSFFDAVRESLEFQNVHAYLEEVPSLEKELAYLLKVHGAEKFNKALAKARKE